jgi:hypothetical protein
MSLRRIVVATAFLSTIAALPAIAQSASTPAADKAAAGSMKGTWVGFAFVNGDQRPVKFTFDSTATGWVGATLIPEMGADSVYLDPVKVTKDSLAFGIPFGAQSIGVRGARSGNLYGGEFVMEGSVIGTLQMARAGTAEAARLLTPPME